MLQIKYGIQIITDDYYIQHMEDGLDELYFEISLSDPAYNLLNEESRIIESSEQQTYRITSIGGSRKTAKIGCQLDLTDWQATLTIGYESLTRTAAAVLTSIAPAGWTVINNTINAKMREITMEAPTPLDVAIQMQKTFGCAVRFDNNAKTATLLYPDEVALSNSYAIDTVNLRRPPEFKGKSSEIYTRLYPLGKDDLGISAVNNGLPYVQNLTYTDKVICKIWRDARYENATSLRDDAQARVDAASQPERSWKLDIVDLTRIDPQRWPDMSLALFTRLLLVDSYKGFRANVLVREDKVYPHYPEKNQITVSTSARSIQRTVRRLYDAIYNPNSAYQQEARARGATT